MAQVGLDDHLAHYDPKKSPKHYLQDSEYVWRNVLKNELQYINRFSASEICGLLQSQGFAIDSIEAQHGDISHLKIHDDYQHQSRNDLSTVRLNIRRAAWSRASR